ncbi:MAG: uroporphyrinogen-III synthase [Acidobacteriota bacterium]
MKPLAGVRVVVTRAASQSAEWVAAFRRAGAEVAALPLLEILPPANPAELAAAADLARRAPFDWWVFTSANAVRAFLPLLSPEVPRSALCAAVGPATEEALEAAGIGVDCRPATDRSHAEGLVRALAPRVAGKRVLVPLAEDARPTMVDGLQRAGAEVLPVVAYRKTMPADAGAQAARLFASPPWGWVTVTSPRLARHLRRVLGERWHEGRSTLRAASIGPRTSAALRDLGLDPAAQAVEPSAAGLVAAVVAAHR